MSPSTVAFLTCRALLQVYFYIWSSFKSSKVSDVQFASKKHIVIHFESNIQTLNTLFYTFSIMASSLLPKTKNANKAPDFYVQLC